MLGIRPEDLEDVALAPDTPADRRLKGDVELTEALGSEIMVHFGDRRAAGDDRGRARARAGRGRRPAGRAGGGGRRHTRRSSGASAPRSRVKEGETAEVAVDTRSLHFFDPETGLGIYDDDPRKELHEQVPGRHRRPPRPPARPARGGVRRRRRSSSSRARRDGRGTAGNVSGKVTITGVWTGPEQQSFQAVLDGVQGEVPERQGQVHRRPATTPRPCSRPRSQGGNPPDLASVSQPGLVKDFANKGALKPIDVREGRRSRRTTRPTGIKLGTVNGKLYGLFFKGANKSTVWYNVHAFTNAGVKPPKTWPRAPQRGEDDQGVGHAGVLDRRRRRLDAHRPVREHLPPAGRAGQVRPADRRTRSRGRTRR